jgi:hypothetical protein
MTQFQRFRALAFIAAVGLVAVGGAELATALTIQVGDTFDGNDCSGEFGQGLESCEIPADIDPDESPIIVKFNFDDGILDLIEVNSIFPTIDGNEFDFDLGDALGTFGTWTYTPAAGDPGITFWAAKGGDGFNLFTDDSGLTVTTGTWFTPLTGGGDPASLSHLSFYDTEGGPPSEVPSPLTLVLVGAALLGIAAAGRLKALVG